MVTLNPADRSMPRSLLWVIQQFAFVALIMVAGCSTVGMIREPSPTEPLTGNLIAVGDIAYCTNAAPRDTAAYRTAELTASLLTSDSEAKVLTLGDNVYEIGLPREFADCYEPTWGKLKSRTWPTPGNHDYGVSNAHGYFDYFGHAAGSDRSGFYQQRMNGWAVISLNSNVDASVASAQYRWLERVLQQSADLCVLAAWHHPVFTSAPRRDQPMMKAIFELLVRHKADLILQGHEHHFERFAPMLADGVIDRERGVRTMVVGTGGAPLSGYRSTARDGSEKQIRAFGVLNMALTPGKAQWQFVSVDRQVLDSGVLNCRRRSTQSESSASLFRGTFP